MPSDLFVEGVSPSESIGDVQLLLRYDENLSGEDSAVSQCDDRVRLTAVKLVAIKFKNQKMTSWRAFDQFYKHIGVFAFQTCSFGVETEPLNFVFPTNSLHWGGLASGTGQITDVTFSTEGMYSLISASFRNCTLFAYSTVKNQPTGVGESAYAAAHPVETALAAASNLVGLDVRKLEPFIWASTQYAGLQHNTVADAARHAYWACLLARIAGSEYASGLTMSHEASNGGPATETVMDILNNQVGIDQSSHSHTNNFDCCREEIISAVDLGFLTYLDSSHGVENVKEDALLQPTNK